MFYFFPGQQLSLKESEDHHRLARSAHQPGAKSHTADHLLFRKENDFHMTSLDTSFFCITQSVLLKVGFNVFGYL